MPEKKVRGQVQCEALVEQTQPFAPPAVPELLFLALEHAAEPATRIITMPLAVNINRKCRLVV